MVSGTVEIYIVWYIKDIVFYENLVTKVCNKKNRIGLLLGTNNINQSALVFHCYVS